MNVNIYYSREQDEGNEVDSFNLLCMDRKVHLTQKRSRNWDGSTTETWTVTGPCDGSCTQVLTTEAMVLVEKFINSEGKEYCEWSKTTKQSSDPQPEEVNRPRYRW